ncbi:MAG: FHA domain-containing protein [Gammaproteobacteria bacterium]
MAKLILTLDGTVIREFQIDKDSISIGRKHGNDVQLNDLTVSGRHALISTMGDNTYIDDLGSTNGTLLNGARVSKSILKHGDTIQTGNYQFTYFCEEAEEFEPTMFLRAEIEDTQVISGAFAPGNDTRGQPLAAVRILNGPLAKKVLELRKSFNTLGFNGVKLAVISRSNEGYTIAALKSSKVRHTDDAPTLNGKTIATEPCKLKDHDMLELAGTQMEFFFFK